MVTTTRWCTCEGRGVQPTGAACGERATCRTGRHGAPGAVRVHRPLSRSLRQQHHGPGAARVRARRTRHGPDGSQSLTWSTYFKKWLLVRSTGGGGGSGFYTYTSDDLINWSAATLMMNAELPWTHTCGEPDYVLYPSLLDPESKSRNFEDTGQRPYLFFTHFNVAYNSGGCYMSLDRDLLRIPMEFSNQVPGGPAAALAASTTSARTGESDRIRRIRVARRRRLDREVRVGPRRGRDLRAGHRQGPGHADVLPRPRQGHRDRSGVRQRGQGHRSDDDRADHRAGAQRVRRGDGHPRLWIQPRSRGRRFRASGSQGSHVARRDGTVVISVQAPAAGRLAVRGARIRAASATAVPAGDSLATGEALGSWPGDPCAAGPGPCQGEADVHAGRGLATVCRRRRSCFASPASRTSPTRCSGALP